MEIENYNLYKKTKKLVNLHNKWMEETINLIASENKLSKGVERCLVSDLGNRVAEGWIGERVFPGLRYYDAIEEIGIDIVKKMFKCDFVDLRPISGTHANMIIFAAFTHPGDSIMSFSVRNGAHISMSGATPKNVFKLNIIDIPVENDGFSINLNKAVSLIQEKRPKLLFFGGSVILFIQQIETLIKICKELDIITVFDASHIVGLIYGGIYPNPIEQGVDLMTFSTCKTLSGPQHAVILSSERYAEKIKRTTFPSILSGHHLHETVGAIISLIELKEFGSEYAKQVVNNAKKLASELSYRGFDVLFKSQGFTETHMFLVKNHTNLSTDELEKRFELGNIIVNRNLLPFDQSYKSPSGFRFGTPEVTRIGMKENDMVRIADFIQQIAEWKEDIKRIKKQVLNFRKQFTKIHYCYDF